MSLPQDSLCTPHVHKIPKKNRTQNTVIIRHIVILILKKSSQQPHMMVQEQTEISPLYALSLCTHLVSLYNTDNLSDVSVLCEDEVFELHSPVLSHASSYFREILVRGENDIVIDESLGIGALEFRILAESMYTGNIRGLSLRNIGKVLKASNVLQMNMAKISCVQFLIDNMNLYYALEFWILGDSIQNDSVTHEAIGLIGRHLEDISKSSTFLQLDLEKVEKILMDDHLMVSNERFVYEAVLSWIRHDLPCREGEFNRLLHAVRMPFLSDRYLIQVLGKEKMILESSSALNAYSEALKVKLENITCQIRTRHSFVHGIVGELDRLFMILSPNPVQGWKHREKIKPFQVPSNLLAVGGFFAKCCAPEENAQGEAPLWIGPLVDPIKRNMVDPALGAFTKIPDNLGKGIQSLKIRFVAVTEPVAKTADSLKKNIESKATNIVDTVTKGVSEIVPFLLNSTKKFVKNIRDHDYDYSSKRQINGFWFAVHTQDASPDQTSKTNNQGGKVYDLSGLEEGGLVSSFSLDEPLEHISEMSEEDRDSVISEVFTDSPSTMLRFEEEDDRLTGADIANSKNDSKQIIGMNGSKKIRKMIGEADLFSPKVDCSEDSSRESEKLVFEESYSVQEEDNEPEEGKIAVESSHSSVMDYSENEFVSDELSRGSDRLIFEENYDSSYLDESDDKCEGNKDTESDKINHEQSSTETSFSNSVDSDDGLMIFS
jgi:hypothetical protein